MPIYICPRCGYSSHIKTYLSKHFARKKICSAISSELTIKECIEQVFGVKNENITKLTHIDSKSDSKMTPIDSELTHLTHFGSQNIKNITKVTPKMSQNIKKLSQSGGSSCENDEENIYECEFCSKTFSKNSNMHRHMKTCKEKNKLFTRRDVAEAKAEVAADKDKVINELKRQIEVLLSKVGNTTHNNTFNISINAYGNENLGYLTNNIINKLVQNGPYKSIPRLIKHIHFNPAHKENHNVKIPNRKEKYAKIYNGESWELRDKKETIEDLSDKAYNIIEDHYEGGNKHVDKFIEEYNDDDVLTKRIHNDTEITILNNQNSIDK